MNLKKLRYLKHCDRVNDFPRTRKEIAIVGRSNVGKSSLINQLSSSSIAKVSKIPGKTRSIHFFALDHENTIADLPGYGFAKVSKKLRGSWKGVVEEYFSCREELIEVILLIDCKAKMTALDEQMRLFLEQNDLPYVIVVTKIDKLNQSQTHALQKEFEKKGIETIFVSIKKPLTKLQLHIHGLLK